MEFFSNANRERLISIAENYINDILDDRGNNIEDLASAFSNAGFTKSEFFAILDKYYLDDYNWAEEPSPAEKVNTETGEGVFWKEYTEDEDVNAEDVNVGDSDQAILETALTQIGIPYTWKTFRDEDGGWINLKMTENKDNTAAKIYFTKDGMFEGIV